MEAVAPIALIAALGSALAHSGMALLTKQAGDTLVFRALSIAMSAVLLLPVALLSPFPEWEVWRFLLMGAVVVWAFNMLMISAFQAGDMNLVYPVMRGAAPALTGLAAWLALGEALSLTAMAGLAVASGAIIAFTWPERGGAPKAAALAFALAAACMTALYTVNDAAGARAASSPFVYVAWHFQLAAVSIGATALVRRGPAAALRAARAEGKRAALSSLFNVTTYALALFAYANAPVAPMAALRETSIVFGAILAALVLRERFGLRRGLLAAVLVAGLAVLQLG